MLFGAVGTWHTAHGLLGRFVCENNSLKRRTACILLSVEISSSDVASCSSVTVAPVSSFKMSLQVREGGVIGGGKRCVGCGDGGIGKSASTNCHCGGVFSVVA